MLQCISHSPQTCRRPCVGEASGTSQVGAGFCVLAISENGRRRENLKRTKCLKTMKVEWDGMVEIQIPDKLHALGKTRHPPNTGEDDLTTTR